MDNILQKENEVIFIGDSTQTINIRENNASNEKLESKEIISCVFCFSYSQSEYSHLMRDMLVGLLCVESKDNSYKDLFYSDGDGVFDIYVCSDSNSILKFANILSEALPLGLCFTFKNIKPLSDDDFMRAKDSKNCNLNCEKFEFNKQEIQNIEFLEKDFMLVPNVLELHALLDKNDKSYRLISPFVCIKSCNLPRLESCDRKQLQNLMENGLIEALAEKLMQEGSITLQRNEEVFTISLKSLESKISLETNQPNTIKQSEPTLFMLLSTIDTAKSYFRMSEAQKSMLASFEKPFIKMQCKEVFAKELGSHVVFVGLSHDIIVLLLLSYLQDNYEKDYIFYMQDSIDNSKNVTAQYIDMYPSRDIESCSYVVAENVYINHLQTHKSLSELLMQNSTNCARFVAFLSTRHDSVFLIHNPQNKEAPMQKILDISFSTDLYSHLKALHGYVNGNKLIYNFAKANGDIVEKWLLQKDELESLGIAGCVSELALHANIKRPNAGETKNLLDVFALISKILNINTGVLFEANRCVRDRGPRIDYKLMRQNDCIVLDYARILRSVMSFKLAGVEDELLCYGVVDSLAEFIGNLAGDMSLNYGIKDVFVCGDLLLWQCFLDKIVKALPKNMNASFPFGGVDYLD